MKRAVFLLGSPGDEGSAGSTADIVRARLEERGWTVRSFRLYDMMIDPCIGCLRCQQSPATFHCSQDDDMREIFDAFLDADLLVAASPIWSSYCTAPMKAALDRLMFAMIKHAGKDQSPSLGAGKRLAAVAACFRPAGEGADLWDEGMRRYCAYTDMRYLGMLAARPLREGAVPPDGEREARAFADRLCDEMDVQ